MSVTISEKDGKILHSLHTLRGIARQPKPKQLMDSTWNYLNETEKDEILYLSRRQNKSLLYYISDPHREPQENPLEFLDSA